MFGGRQFRFSFYVINLETEKNRETESKVFSFFFHFCVVLYHIVDEDAIMMMMLKFLPFFDAVVVFCYYVLLISVLFFCSLVRCLFSSSIFWCSFFFYFTSFDWQLKLLQFKVYVVFSLCTNIFTHWTYTLYFRFIFLCMVLRVFFLSCWLT